MSWCPVCKCEYKDGIEKCADCNVDLVDSLDQVQEDEIHEMHLNVMTGLLEEESEKETDSEEEKKEMDSAKKTGMYRDNAELSNDNKSSAYVLLGVGIVGAIFLVLVVTDIIPLYHTVTSKIMTSSLMGSLFVVFILMGFISLKNAKKYNELAIKESDLSKEIMQYCHQKLTASSIDEALMDEEFDVLEEEEKYFKRMDYIQGIIEKQFMNLDSEYVEHLCDKVYTKLYEE